MLKVAMACVAIATVGVAACSAYYSGELQQYMLNDMCTFIETPEVDEATFGAGVLSNMTSDPITIESVGALRAENIDVVKAITVVYTGNADGGVGIGVAVGDTSLTHAADADLTLDWSTVADAAGSTIEPGVSVQLQLVLRRIDVSRPAYVEGLEVTYSTAGSVFVAQTGHRFIFGPLECD